MKINKDINDIKNFLQTYFGTPNNKYNGYLQKNDIYALGISIYEFIILYNYIILNNLNTHKIKTINIDNEPYLLDLLRKMIYPDSLLRLNVNECINHPYFSY